jgi:hypothetical protein
VPVHLLCISTLSHKLGHLLGVGNLYDTGTSASGAGNGIGNYDLMVYGSFGFDNTGYYPTNLSAYHKLFMGWVAHKDIIAGRWYTLWSGIHQVHAASRVRLYDDGLGHCDLPRSFATGRAYRGFPENSDAVGTADAVGAEINGALDWTLSSFLAMVAGRAPSSFLDMTAAQRSPPPRPTSQ